jgi:hypothetical protein
VCNDSNGTRTRLSKPHGTWRNMLTGFDAAQQVKIFKPTTMTELFTEHQQIQASLQGLQFSWAQDLTAPPVARYRHEMATLHHLAIQRLRQLCGVTRAATHIIRQPPIRNPHPALNLIVLHRRKPRLPL